MLHNWTRIDLATRLRTMNRILDRMVPDPAGETVQEAIATMLEAVSRHGTTQAVTVLEDVLGANPFWVRGYLLIATIHQHARNTERAMAAIEEGLAACAGGLRLFSAEKWVEAVEQINGTVVHSRIQSHAQRLKRYEHMFRYRLAMLQIRCGNFDDAIQQWSTIEEEHCA